MQIEGAMYPIMCMLRMNGHFEKQNIYIYKHFASWNAHIIFYHDT